MTVEITRAWQALGAGPVAVRSSAIAEDLEGASFAGQQDTYLNVRGAQALLAAVRDCWAARAMAYRARQGIDPAAVSLAVVVQEMVEADAAGVMFTANPTNGRRDEVVVSAAEYGIPAVLGTGVATRRISDGTRVLGNGDAGTVTLLDEAADPSATPPESSSRRRPGPRVVGVPTSAR